MEKMKITTPVFRTTAVLKINKQVFKLSHIFYFMADSIATVYDGLRGLEATIESIVDNKPLYDEDVPPTPTVCPLSKLTVPVDVEIDRDLGNI
jgi:hypothetical protein